MRHPIAVGTILVACASGCLPAGGGGGGGTTPPLGDSEFTAARQAAVTEVVGIVVGAAEAGGVLSALTDSRMTLKTGGFGSFGTCPVVSFVSSVGSSAGVHFDFGTGCTAAATGSATVSGAVDFTLALQTGDARVDWRSTSFNGHGITGYLAGTYQAAADGNVVVDGTGQIDVQSAGQFQGRLQIGLATSGQTTLGATDVTLIGQQLGYTATLTSVQADPFQWDSLVPVSGSVQFTTGDLVPIVIRFTQRSAQEGIVLVTVGTGSAVTFKALTP